MQCEISGHFAKNENFLVPLCKILKVNMKKILHK